MNKFAILAGCCFLLLSACDSGGSGVRTSSVATTPTPTQLRVIETNELSAQVTIDGNTTTYFGSNYPDNSWIILLNIEAAREYEIKIEWFAQTDILLLRQEGTLFASNAEDTAVPVVSETTEGAGFDYNCNGISNLNEIRAGTNPGTPTSMTCRIESDPINVVAPSDIQSPPTLTETVIPIAVQFYDTFENEIGTTRINRFSQPINIQSSNPNRRTAYRASLGNTATGYSISIDLSNDPRFGRFARFFNNNVNSGVTVEPAVGADATCSEFNCAIPFDWEQNHWYELVFEEDPTDRTQLRASIIDTETQLSTPLGSFTIPDTAVWRTSWVLVYYHEPVVAADCVAGLLPATMHYRSATANNETLGGPASTPATPCLTWGGGASTTQITGDPAGDIYTITLGE